MAGRGGGMRNNPNNKQSVTTKLFVGNLPETVRKPDLLALFQKYGKVVECDIVKNYAFVHYDDEVEAKAAVAALHESEFMGVNIRVEVSHSKVRQQPGMGGRGECYRCGGDGHWSKDCPRGPKRRNGPPMDDFGYDRDPYREPYYGRDRFDDRERYPPPPDRYKPYGDPYERRGDRRPPPPPPRDPYYRDRDPYGRPPPDYYSRSRSPPRDPYFPPYYDRRGDDPYYDYYSYYYRRPPPPPGYDRESSEDGGPPPPPHERNSNNFTDFTNDEPQFT